jgi:hypothetical protein
MKKIFFVLNLLCLSIISKAQMPISRIEILKNIQSDMHNLNSNNKSVRSVNAQMVKIDRFLDTSATFSYTNKAYLKSESVFYYNKNMAATQGNQTVNFNPYAIPQGYYRYKAVDNITTGNSDSLSYFNTYDAKNRVISKVEVYFNGLNYDTFSVYNYAYSGNNLEADSAFFKLNMSGGLQLVLVYKQFINNNLVDSTYSFSDINGAFTLDFIERYSYDTNKNIIESGYALFPFNNLYDVKNNYFYTGIFLDSLKLYTIQNNQLSLYEIQLFKYVTPNIINKTFFSIDSGSTTRNLRVIKWLSLNADKQVVKIANYNVSGSDSILNFNNYYTFNAAKDLTAEYQKIVFKCNRQHQLLLYHFYTCC